MNAELKQRILQAAEKAYRSQPFMTHGTGICVPQSELNLIETARICANIMVEAAMGGPDPVAEIERVFGFKG